MTTIKSRVVATARDHTLDGARAGVLQIKHGKDGRLGRMSAGDRIFYAGKTVYGEKELSQRFVAFAILTDDNIFDNEWTIPDIFIY